VKINIFQHFKYKKKRAVSTVLLVIETLKILIFKGEITLFRKQNSHPPRHFYWNSHYIVNWAVKYIQAVPIYMITTEENINVGSGCWKCNGVPKPRFSPGNFVDPPLKIPIIIQYQSIHIIIFDHQKTNVFKTS